MGDNEGRIAYLEDGREVLVMGGQPGAWLVRVALEDSGTGEPMGYSKPRVEASIFDRPPVAKMDAAIAEAREELSEILSAVAEAREEMSAFETKIAARRALFEDSPIAKGLEATLNGTAWWVIERSYGQPEAVRCVDYKLHESDRRDGRTVLKLEQRVSYRGIDLHWAILRRDYNETEVGIYVTEDEAMSEVRRRILAKMTEQHHIPNASLLAHAVKMGVTPPPGYESRVKAILMAEKKKAVDSARASLVKAEAEMASFIQSGTDGSADIGL